MNTNDYPLVSVIIPFYNHNKYIKRTLDSIIEDLYPNKEIIIINDGSSDPDDSNITAWIEEYDESLPVKYIKRENHGVTKTMNELIDLSNGKYILPCSSDDYFVNNTITKRVELLEQVESKNKLILISDNIVVDERNNVLFDSNLFELRHVDSEKLSSDDGLKFSIIHQWAFAGPSWIANKKLFDEYNLYFDENLLVEDWDFFLRVVASEFALFYDEKVSAYRLHNNNTCRNNSLQKRMLEDFKNVALKNSKYFDEPFKSDLLNHAQNYEKQIKNYWKKNLNPFKWFRIKTKTIRYAIKNKFKYAK